MSKHIFEELIMVIYDEPLWTRQQWMSLHHHPEFAGWGDGKKVQFMKFNLRQFKHFIKFTSATVPGSVSCLCFLEMFLTHSADEFNSWCSSQNWYSAECSSSVLWQKTKRDCQVGEMLHVAAYFPFRKKKFTHNWPWDHTAFSAPEHCEL